MKTSALILAATFFIPLTCNADLMFTLEGTPGSSDYTLSASGTFTFSDFSAINGNGDVFMIPIETTWYAPTFGWTDGGFFGVDPTSTFETGTSGVITFEVSNSSTSIHTFNDVHFTGEAWIPYDASNTLDWADLSPTDVTTITASGSITFSSDVTFDDLLPETYKYEAVELQDGLSYLVQASAVPEPSGFGIAGVVGLLALVRRRKRPLG